MFDIIRKSMLAGIGAVAMTQEAVQGLITDFVERGKITEQEGRTLVNDLQQAVYKNTEKLSTMIDERVTYVMNQLNLVTKEDLAAVNERLAKLEQHVNELKSRPQA